GPPTPSERRAFLAIEIDGDTRGHIDLDGLFGRGHLTGKIGRDAGRCPSCMRKRCASTEDPACLKLPRILWRSLASMRPSAAAAAIMVRISRLAPSLLSAPASKPEP